MHIDRDRIGAGGERPVGDVEEAEAPGTPEKFPGGTRQIVAVEAAHIDRHLPHGLAGVEDVGNAGIATDPAHRLGRLHQPGVGGDPGQGDDGGLPPAHQLAKPLEVDAALRGVGRADHLHAAPPGERKVENLVGGVVVLAGQDQVAGRQVERRKGLGKSHGRVLLHREVAWSGAQQAGEGPVRPAQRLLPPLGRLVRTDPSL